VKKIPINSGIELAGLFWPKFVKIKGCIFLKRNFQGENPGRNLDVSYPVQTESDSSHTHILDYFAHKAGLRREPFFDSKHPDFKKAYEIGRTLCHLWASKLKQDFPKDDFRIYLHGFDPIVRFHKIRKGIPNWAEPIYWQGEIKAGNALILDTRKVKHP
jgi:hypothetical protein